MVKKRNPVAVKTHQRQHRAGGPHDTSRTRAEEKREAIEEQMTDVFCEHCSDIKYCCKDTADDVRDLQSDVGGFDWQSLVDKLEHKAKFMRPAKGALDAVYIRGCAEGLREAKRLIEELLND